MKIRTRVKEKEPMKEGEERSEGVTLRLDSLGKRKRGSVRS